MNKASMFSNQKPPKKNDTIRLVAEDKNQYIYFNPEGTPNTFETDSEIELIPSNKAREILYVTGPSGSGKSHFASKYVEKFCEIFPDSKILLFSRKDSDKVFDDIKQIKRIKIDKELVDAKINILTSCKENTLLIFDDIDSLPKEYWECIAAMIYDLCEVGRSYKIYGIITSHLVNSNNKKFSRIILNEAHYVVFFPKTNIKGNKYFLENYCGLEKNAIKELLNKNTRAITIHRNYPNFYISKFEIGPLVSDIMKDVPKEIKTEEVKDDKPKDASLIS
jgi:DNA replication protein DnaC